MKKLLFAFAAALILTAGLANPAPAQDFPQRPIHLIIAFGPGGGSDIIGRILAESLQTKLGQAVVVENKPGAGGILGNDMVARATPDGYTLGIMTAGQLIAAVTTKKMPYDSLTAFAPVGQIATASLMIVTRPDFPANDVKELVAYAKANPGKINMGSGGIGSGNQLTGEMFKTMTGVDLVHVPYRGAGPAMVDLMGGQVQVMFNTMGASLQYVRGGKLRALGVATKTRQAALPDVPTVAEFVPGYEASFWTGVAAPKGTPPEIVDKLNKAVNAALADRVVKGRLAEWGATALAGSPADFGKFVADETEKWGKVIRTANIKAE